MTQAVNFCCERAHLPNVDNAVAAHLPCSQGQRCFRKTDRHLRAIQDQQIVRLALCSTVCRHRHGQRRNAHCNARVRSRATNGEILRDAAISGMGLVLLPAWIVADDVAYGNLVSCLPNARAWPAGFDTEIIVVHRRLDPLPAKISAFVAALLALEPEVSLEFPADEYPG